MSDIGKTNPQTDNLSAPSPDRVFKMTLEQQQLATQMALRNPAISRIYANGFGLALTQSDISVVLNVNGNPLAILDLSYVTAKSLMTDLGNLIRAYEKATGQVVKTAAELQPAMEKIMAEKNAK